MGGGGGLRGAISDFTNLVKTLLTTKGDLLTFSTVPARLSVGANNTVLTADSTQTLGMKWATVSTVSKNVIIGFMDPGNPPSFFKTGAAGFVSLVGYNNYTTEAQSQAAMPCAGTLKNVRLKVPINSNTNNGTVKSRINGADGNITVTVTASTTGTFSDTSNTDTIAAADLVCYSATQAATGNCVASPSAEFDPT